jgi:MerR family mercuric resistance operon transcriptional regulator
MDDSRFAGTFSIGELSRRATVAVETIRYYERIGLLPRPRRTRGGRRTYEPQSCRRLAFVRRARELGFTLEDIRTLLALRDAKGTCNDVKSVAARHLRDVRTKIQDLIKLEAALAATVDRCPDDQTTDCPVLSSLDQGCRTADAVAAISCCSPPARPAAAGSALP